MGFFYYLVLRPGKLTRALGGAGMLACLYFILKNRFARRVFGAWRVSGGSLLFQPE